jgi:23S rRNA pseudouridine2605 synthase
MRINRFIALATGLSRRAADKLADAGELLVNGHPIKAGREVTEADRITLRGKRLRLPKTQTIILNKPVGYVCSRDGQGSKTVYDLLPADFHALKPVGRLDKDSSGLLLMTNDGDLAHKLTHPKFVKRKVYEVELNKPLVREHWERITKKGVLLEDGLSKFDVYSQRKSDGCRWIVTMHEGRNRQIRRTFARLGYEVVRLHRTAFGNYNLSVLGNKLYVRYDAKPRQT